MKPSDIQSTVEEKLGGTVDIRLNKMKSKLKGTGLKAEGESFSYLSALKDLLKRKDPDGLFVMEQNSDGVFSRVIQF